MYTKNLSRALLRDDKEENSKWLSRVIFHIGLASLSFIGCTIVAIYASRKRLYLVPNENFASKHVKGKHPGECGKLMERGGLTSPYRRIIFGICLSDAIYAFALATGPFLASKEFPLARLAIGNSATCTLNGLFVGIGMLLTPLYVCFLCFYYFCKLSLKMDDETFKRKFEIKLYVIMTAVTLAVNIPAAAMGTINTAPTGVLCMPGAAYPTGCQQRPDLFGECDERIEKQSGVIMYITYAVMVLALFCVILFMGKLTTTVVQRHTAYGTMSTNTRRQGKSIKRETSGLEDEENSENKTSVPSNPEFQDIEADESNLDQQMKAEIAEKLRMLYFRLTRTQFALWVTTYLFSIIPYIIMGVTTAIKGVMPLDQPEPLRWFASLFYPSLGILITFIFTRPAIKYFRQMKPEFSWVRSFILVVKEGGEVPVRIVKSANETNERNISVSSKSAYGVGKKVSAPSLDTLGGLPVANLNCEASANNLQVSSVDRISTNPIYDSKERKFYFDALASSAEKKIFSGFSFNSSQPDWKDDDLSFFELSAKHEEVEMVDPSEAFEDDGNINSL